MKFGPTRQHISYIFENFVRDGIQLLLALIFIVIAGAGEEGIQEFLIGGVFLIGPLFKCITYYFTIISVEDDMLIVQSGCLRRRRKVIPISSVTTINMTQNIFHQIFRAYRMIINNSSNISEDDEVNITLSKAKAQELKDLLSRESGVIDGATTVAATDFADSQARVYTVSDTELMLYGALKSKGATILKMVGAILAFIGFFGELFENTFDRIFDAIVDKMSLTDVSDAGVPIIIALILIAIIMSILMGAAGGLLKYYDFKITDYGSELHISYGLFTKKDYKFDKTKIAGIRFEQPVLMRLAGIGMLKCIAVGYGWGDSEESKEDPMLLPLVKSADFEKIMSAFIPELAKRSPEIKADKRYAYYFLYRPIFPLTVIMVIALCVAGRMLHPGLYAVAVVILILGMTSICLQFINTSIASNSDNVRIGHGGFAREIDCIRTDYVESVTDNASVLKRRKGIAHIEVGYFAKDGHSTAVNVNKSAADQLMSFLRT